MIPIIYAHPNTKGHCSFILSEVEKQLKSLGENYKVFDLYKMKYDPVMHEKEHYTGGGRAVSAANKKFQKLISDSEVVIYIYPIWWGTYPAILKGFIDKVFVSGFAFKYINGRPKGLLKGRRAIVFATSGGSRLIYRTVLFDIPKKVISMLNLGFCGIKTKYYQIGGCMRLDDKKKTEIRKKVHKGLAKI